MRGGPGKRGARRAVEKHVIGGHFGVILEKGKRGKKAERERAGWGMDGVGDGMEPGKEKW